MREKLERYLGASLRLKMMAIAIMALFYVDDFFVGSPWVLTAKYTLIGSFASLLALFPIGGGKNFYHPFIESEHPKRNILAIAFGAGLIAVSITKLWMGSLTLWPLLGAMWFGAYYANGVHVCSITPKTLRNAAADIRNTVACWVPGSLAMGIIAYESHYKFGLIPYDALNFLYVSAGALALIMFFWSYQRFLNEEEETRPSRGRKK